jgi:hypothetical protein
LAVERLFWIGSVCDDHLLVALRSWGKPHRGLDRCCNRKGPLSRTSGLCLPRLWMSKVAGETKY